MPEPGGFQLRCVGGGEIWFDEGDKGGDIVSVGIVGEEL